MVSVAMCHGERRREGAGVEPRDAHIAARGSTPRLPGATLAMTPSERRTADD